MRFRGGCCRDGGGFLSYSCVLCEEGAQQLFYGFPWFDGNLSQPPLAWGIRLPIEIIVKSARLVSARGPVVGRCAKSVGGRWLSVPIGSAVQTRLSAVETEQSCISIFPRGVFIFSDFSRSPRGPPFLAPLSADFHKGNRQFWSVFDQPD